MKKREMLRVDSNEMELVDFRIYKKTLDGKIYEGIYGINVAKVREIIKMPELTELPGGGEYVEGIFDLRGVVVPVINLAKWMNIELPPLSDMKIIPRVIITEFNNVLIGFIVHEAKRIRRIGWKDIEPATFTASHGNIDKSKITGITRIEDNEILLILDLESIVEEVGLYNPTLDTDIEVEKFEGIILVVDDSNTARKIEGDTLKEMGFDVVDAIDGEDALKKLEELYSIYGDKIKDSLKLILSDVEMPKMDGFHFAARVKDDERFKDIPIVFSSSISDAFSEARGKEAGADEYVVKFDANSFVHKIANVIKSHQKDN
jgi:two-component system chemotaxis response regulator CheV